MQSMNLLQKMHWTHEHMNPIKKIKINHFSFNYKTLKEILIHENLDYIIHLENSYYDDR